MSPLQILKNEIQHRLEVLFTGSSFRIRGILDENKTLREIRLVTEVHHRVKDADSPFDGRTISFEAIKRCVGFCGEINNVALVPDFVNQEAISIPLKIWERILPHTMGEKPIRQLEAEGIWKLHSDPIHGDAFWKNTKTGEIKSFYSKGEIPEPDPQGL